MLLSPTVCRFALTTGVVWVIGVWALGFDFTGSILTINLKRSPVDALTLKSCPCSSTSLWPCNVNFNDKIIILTGWAAHATLALGLIKIIIVGV